MDFKGKYSDLTAHIAALRKQQIAANDRAIYCGWTPETTAEYDKRADLLATLHRRLDQSSRPSTGDAFPKLRRHAG